MCLHCIVVLRSFVSLHYLFLVTEPMKCKHIFCANQVDRAHDISKTGVHDFQKLVRTPFTLSVIHYLNQVYF